MLVQFVRVSTAHQFGRSLLTYWAGHASFPERCKDCSRKKILGGLDGNGFCCPQGGGVLELSVSEGWRRKWTEDVLGVGCRHYLRWYIAIILYIDPSLLYGRVQCGDAFYLQLWSKTIVQYDRATGEFLTLTPSLGVIPCEYRQKWYIAKTRFFELHFCRRIYWCIFNHFYAMRPGSYRIWWNNAK